MASFLRERLDLALVARAIPHPGAHDGVMTLSAGVAAMIPTRDEPSLQLVAKADAALYRAKREGRNRVVVGE